MLKRVLVVDDDINILKMLELVGRTVGLNIDSATTAEAALVKLKSGEYRMLVTDLMMPGMDGFSLARAAKSRSPDLEVVLMTGSIMSDLQEQAVDAGISKVVAKPFGIDLLIELFN
ncbi:MAG: response regulator [Deltaproteobacteria bacterium HGW-Deltaproteobacteria-23]|jgi:CheY-like chemotaxis protein|nr:MAG: response regulator [Deltaproteobacteria bacterium HGW-Deltaproteobacteria-23]